MTVQDASSAEATDSLQQQIENGVADLPPPVANVPVSSLDIYDTDVLTDPWPHYETLREAGPVVWLTRYGVYAITHHEQVKDILTDNETFGSSAGAGLTNFNTTKPWRKPSLLLEADRPEHDRTRQAMMHVMNPRTIRGFRATFEALADAMVDDMIAKGNCDGVTDLAERFPLKAFGDAVGIPTDGRDKHLLPYGDMVFNGFGPANARFHERLATIPEAAQWIAHACARDTLTKDGLGAQLYTAVDRGELQYEEAELLVRSLLSAGLDTTVFALANAIIELARHQDQWEVLKANPAIARQAVEEVLRYAGIFHTFYRTTTRPTEVCGVKMDKNQKVLVVTASANRDPRQWERPDTLDITRKASGHMAFGTGIHGCAGQMMARLEGEIVLTAMAKKLGTLELTGEPVLHYNNTVRGYKSAPMRVTGR